MARIELYGTAGCQATQDMREWLDWRGVEFAEFDVEADPQARERLRALAGDPRTVPVLIEDGRVAQVGWQGRGCVIGDHTPGNMQAGMSPPPLSSRMGG